MVGVGVKKRSGEKGKQELGLLPTRESKISVGCEKFGASDRQERRETRASRR